MLALLMQYKVKWSVGMIREEAIKLLDVAKDTLKLGEFSKVSGLMSVGEYINAVTRTVYNYPSTMQLSAQVEQCVHKAVQNKRNPTHG